MPDWLAQNPFSVLVQVKRVLITVAASFRVFG
jgi:hypothetical protein